VVAAVAAAAQLPAPAVRVGLEFEPVVPGAAPGSVRPAQPRARPAAGAAAAPLEHIPRSSPGTHSPPPCGRPARHRGGGHVPGPRLARSSHSERGAAATSGESDRVADRRAHTEHTSPDQRGRKEGNRRPGPPSHDHVNGLGTDKRDNMDRRRMPADPCHVQCRARYGAVTRSCRHEVGVDDCRQVPGSAYGHRPSQRRPRPSTTRSDDPGMVLRRMVAADHRRSVPIGDDLHCGHIGADLVNRCLPDGQQRAHFKIYRPDVTLRPRRSSAGIRGGMRWLAVDTEFGSVSATCPGRAGGSTACTCVASRTSTARCGLVARPPSRRWPRVCLGRRAGRPCPVWWHRAEPGRPRSRRHPRPSG